MKALIYMPILSLATAIYYIAVTLNTYNFLLCPKYPNTPLPLSPQIRRGNLLWGKGIFKETGNVPQNQNQNKNKNPNPNLDLDPSRGKFFLVKLRPLEASLFPAPKVIDF